MSLRKPQTLSESLELLDQLIRAEEPAPELREEPKPRGRKRKPETELPFPVPAPRKKRQRLASPNTDISATPSPLPSPVLMTFPPQINSELIREKQILEEKSQKAGEEVEELKKQLRLAMEENIQLKKDLTSEQHKRKALFELDKQLIQKLNALESTQRTPAESLFPTEFTRFYGALFQPEVRVPTPQRLPAEETTVLTDLVAPKPSLPESKK